MNCPSYLQVLSTCNLSCNLSWRSLRTAALHQTIYPWNLASFTKIFRGTNLNNFLGKVTELSLWTEFYVSVFRDECCAGCWCRPCSFRAVLLCVLLLEWDLKMARLSLRFFPLIPKAVTGSCNRNQLRSVGKEERKELSCQTAFAELCPAGQGLGEGRKKWWGNFSERNAVTAVYYFSEVWLMVFKNF